MRGITGDDGSRSKAQASEEHLHLLAGRILRFIENNEGIVQRATAHERQWCHLNDIALNVFCDRFESQHLVKCVIQGSQIGVHFLCQIPR